MTLRGGGLRVVLGDRHPEPSITALELRDEVYVLAGRAVGDESLIVTAPFSVTIVPARLLD